MKGKELKNIIESNNLTASDASELLGVSRGTLYNWFKRENLDLADVLLINSKLKSLNLPDNQVQEPGTDYQYSDSSLIKQVPFSEFMETQYLSIEAQAGYLDSLESQEIDSL